MKKDKQEHDDGKDLNAKQGMLKGSKELRFYNLTQPQLRMT